MNILTFRATLRQRWSLAIAAGASAALTVIFLGGAALWGWSTVHFAVFVTGPATAVFAPVFLFTLTDTTSCLPEGLHSRRFGRSRFRPWSEISDIKILEFTYRGTTTSTVQIQPTTGKPYKLGTPVAGGLMPDPDFAAKADRLRAFWHDSVAAGTPLGPTEVDATTEAERSSRISRWTLGIGLTLCAAGFLPFTFAEAAPSWSVLVGHGRYGVFTPVFSDCDAVSPCTWSGTFTPDRGDDVRLGVTLVGATVNSIDDRIRAIDVGDGSTVYSVRGGTSWINRFTVATVVEGTILLSATAVVIRRYRRRRRLPS